MGCIVVLVFGGVVVGVEQCGGVFGICEFGLFDLVNFVQEVYVVVFLGGSVFGFDVVLGVVCYFEEKGIGFDVGVVKVLIVVGVIFFDLCVGDVSVCLMVECGYVVVRSVLDVFVVQGNEGVGVGVIVGKWFGIEWFMKGGFGSVLIIIEDGFIVVVLVVVNVVGDVVDLYIGCIIVGV